MKVIPSNAEYFLPSNAEYFLARIFLHSPEDSIALNSIINRYREVVFVVKLALRGDVGQVEVEKALAALEAP